MSRGSSQRGVDFCVCTSGARLAATFQASVDAWMLHKGHTLDGIDLKAFGVRKLGTEVEERP
jgi:hypothetical protein